MSKRHRNALQSAGLETPAGLNPTAITAVARTLNLVFSDPFAAYVKTSKLSQYVYRRHFRNHGLPADPQAPTLSETKGVAGSVRKTERTTGIVP